MSDYEWDVFISHATEDKEAVARPLATKLAEAGIRVWLDSNELTVGDSLRRKIDHGLAHSRYGVVILSPAFFCKQWPQSELSSLFALESTRNKVILPVWHQVDRDSIARHSPLLADRLGISTAAGLDEVCVGLISAVRTTDPPSPGTRRIPHRFWWTRFIPGVLLVLSLSIAGWTLYSRTNADPLGKLKTAETESAAAEFFRHSARAAGYADAEVLDSWVVDFMFEHWIPREVILRILGRESSANGAGDLSIGIWNDPTAVRSSWRVSTGLTTPNVRPAIGSPSFVMDARGIEPGVGPHRTNAAGLSSAGWSLVLGVYTKSYVEFERWICANFSPLAVPFADMRPLNVDFEQVSVQPAAHECPTIRFQALRTVKPSSATERFRALLNLPPLPAFSEPADTLYVNVSREADPHPLPVRVSLLWLKRARQEHSSASNEKQR
jgi:hypothetical protein